MIAKRLQMDQDKKVNETFDVLGSKTESVSGNHVEEKTHPYQLHNQDTINKPVRYAQNPETVKQINIIYRKKVVNYQENHSNQ